MKFQTAKGTITVNPEVFAQIGGYAASNCFGVKGMAKRGMADGIVSLLKNEMMSKGVKIYFTEGQVSIDLHIAVEHGININAVCESIMGEVRYVVERYTGIKVLNVRVYVDSIMTD